MKFSRVALATAAACAARAHASAVGVTPVQKVLQLLENMSVKGKKEKHEEQVQFAAFKQFCDDTTVDKKRSISEAVEQEAKLAAHIQKKKSDVSKLGKEIGGHDQDMAVFTGDKKAATNVRTIENTDYKAMHKDYSESVDALQRAIAVVRKQSHDRNQAVQEDGAFAQLQSSELIPAEAKQAIDAFLQSGASDIGDYDNSASEAAGYEFQSHGVVDMLEKLHDKFVTERTDTEKKELNSKHAFDLLVQDLDAQIGQSKADRTLKATNKAKALQSKADAEGDLTDTASMRKADEKYVQDLEATCSQKASDYESRQQLRAEELVAIAKAVEIISGGTVAGHASTYMPELLQRGGSALVQQLRSGGTRGIQQRAADFLSSRAEALHSRVLSTLATKVSGDPFEKVKKMLKDLIVRLLEEANEEATHKGWCDTELATNEATRKEKTSAVETLHAEIDQLEASTAKLTEDIGELHGAVAGLTTAMAEATGLRTDEKTKNEQTIKDSSEAQTAVAQALSVLREFYAKAAEATALVQARQQPESPEIFDGAYQGMGAENGGVIGMLEVIQADFARLEADTTAGEAVAQKEYDEFMTDSKVDKAAKETDVEHKTAKKQDQSQAHTSKIADLDGTQKELDAALMFFDKLKPSCIDSGVTFEDRVARRQEEIQSLKEALSILSGNDIA